MPAPESYDVFLSHVSEDAELARSLASVLRADRLHVFLAEDTISAGENWYRTIEGAVSNAAVVVVLIGPRAKTSKWMAAEWMAAVTGAMSGQLLLVPVLVGSVDAGELPLALQQFPAFRLDTPAALEEVARVIARAVSEAHGAIGELAVVTAPILPPDYVDIGVAERILAAVDTASRERLGPVEVVGAAGAGKTIAAAAACRAAGDRWGVVAWIDASSEQTVIRGLADLGQRLGHVEASAGPEQLAAAACQRLASGDAGWLLVFDDADEAQGWLPRWIPAASASGTAIVIARRELGLGGPVVRLAPLDYELAVSLLERRLGTQFDDDDRHALPELMAAIGPATPLSVVLIAAALDRERGPIKDRIDGLLATLIEPAPQAAETIGSAVARRLQDLARRRPVAGRIGEVLATADRIAVPVALLQGAADDSFLMSDPDEVSAALAELEAVGLIRITPSGATPTHPLIAQVLRRGTPWSEVIGFLARAAARRRDAGGRDDREIAALRDLARQALANTPEMTSVVSIAATGQLAIEGARALLDTGHALAAVALLEEALEASERALGPTDAMTLTIRSSLAGALHATGELDRAAALLEQTLADSERVLGLDDPSTLSTRANLAATLQSAGRLEDALVLLERTLADSERVLGPAHPSTLGTRANLAVVLQSLGRVDAAVALLEQTVADSEALFGSDHPSTLSHRAQLAAATQQNGQLERALALWQQTAGDTDRLLGPGHPSTLVARSNLAAALEAIGRTEDAVALLAEILAVSEEVLGPDDALTGAVRHNLAYVRG
jgi:tetratricopeptide (TPR) repeat protein